MTPLRDAVEGYLEKDRARFHMPGHKGVPCGLFGDILRYDITEVAGTDNLYEADGPIAETERMYAGLYGAAGSFLSAGGSTLCIQAMLALAVKPGDKLICGRGVHTAAVSAMALLGLHPVWVYSDGDPLTGLSAPMTAEKIGSALTEHPDARAVYITSPTYYGLLADIAAISRVCRRQGVPLLVDNAHGAHLKFLRESLHPIDSGADLCCDGLHKTLPVLTGGAMLHVGNPSYLEDAKRRMALFGSTSPSYLILLSAEAAVPYLRNGAAADLERVSARVSDWKRLASERGFLLPRGLCDPTRLTLGFAPLGFTADSFRAHLASHGIEPEYLSGEYCVFLAGGSNRDGDFERLLGAVADTPPPPSGQAGARTRLEPFPRSEQALSLREAAFADCEQVPVEKAAGRVAAATIAPCPPGIPLIMPGERLSLYTIFTLKSYGILSVHVIK